MWNIVLLVFGIITLAAAGFVVTRIHRLSFIKKLSEKNAFLSWGAAVLPVLLIGLFCFINVFTMVIVLLHFFVGFLIADIISFIVRKASKKNFSYDIQTFSAIAFTIVYLCVGWFAAHHVFITNYTFFTEKEIGEDIRIVEIADSHLGITLDGKDFAEQMERVQKTEPDAVVIVGDFVDDDTEKQDMIDACKSLGRLKTKYGVFFVYGNHDEGYYNYRNFNSEELCTALRENGVVILSDENLLIDDKFYIVGRKDRSMPERMEAKSLTETLDDSKYIIMLDHQPNDYEKEARTEADLVLSGHTHGGHIFPAGQLGLLMGANDRIYGVEERNNTVFVVTSGISGWAIPFKTGTFSEFVVIDIKQK